MRALFWSIIIAILASFLIGTGFFLLFGYDPYAGILENLGDIYSKISFWKGFGIWSLLYIIFFSLPIAFLHRSAAHE